ELQFWDIDAPLGSDECIAKTPKRENWLARRGRGLTRLAAALEELGVGLRRVTRLLVLALAAHVVVRASALVRGGHRVRSHCSRSLSEERRKLSPGPFSVKEKSTSQCVGRLTTAGCSQWSLTTSLVTANRLASHRFQALRLTVSWHTHCTLSAVC